MIAESGFRLWQITTHRAPSDRAVVTDEAGDPRGEVAAGVMR